MPGARLARFRDSQAQEANADPEVMRSAKYWALEIERMNGSSAVRSILARDSSPEFLSRCSSPGKMRTGNRAKMALLVLAI